MSKQITCPYCFTQFNLREALFRCNNGRCPGRVPDEVLAAFQGYASAPLLPPSFEVPGGGGLLGLRRRNAPDEALCPHCQQETSKRICPNCHYELMYDVGQVNERIVAVVGGRGTGKSNYIATLVHTLENSVGANFDASVRAMGDGTRRRYEEDFYTPLYRNHEVIPPTAPAATNVSTRTPMIFRINFQGRRKGAVNLVLFDTAGEDMQSLDTMSTEARYICYADALVFLLDPLQIETVREQLGPNVRLPQRDPGAEPVHIVERLLELYAQQFRMKPDQKINKPFAFTLSKIDAVLPLMGPGSGLHHAGEHFGALQAAGIESIHTEITAVLQSWMGPHFNGLVRDHFSNYRYFGVSSFGHSPSPENRLEAIAPIRVEDPLLWIFHQFGLIKNR